MAYTLHVTMISIQNSYMEDPPHNRITRDYPKHLEKGGNYFKHKKFIKKIHNCI